MEPLKALVDTISKKLDSVDYRLRGLWGNGTGPPGYLEKARDEDKRRNDEVDEQHQLVLQKVEELQTQLVTAQGVQKGEDKSDARHAQSVAMWVGIGVLIVSFGLLVAAAFTFWATWRLKTGELTAPRLRSLRSAPYADASYAAEPPVYQPNGRIQ